MKINRQLAIVLMLVVTLIGGAAPSQGPAPMVPLAYAESTLLSHDGENLSVIVTADDAGVAIRAVEGVGGQVASDLWLIHAVAATVPAGELQPLAAYPGVVSFVDNKGVTTANGPGWDGWGTEIRDLPDHWDGHPDVQSTNSRKSGDWPIRWPSTWGLMCCTSKP